MYVIVRRKKRPTVKVHEHTCLLPKAADCSFSTGDIIKCAHCGKKYKLICWASGINYGGSYEWRRIRFRFY